MTVKAQTNPRGYLRFRIYWRGREFVIGTKYRDDGPTGRFHRLVHAKAVMLNEKLEAGAELHRALLDVLGDCPPRLLPKPKVGNPTIAEWAKTHLRRLAEKRSRRSLVTKTRQYLDGVLIPLCGHLRLSEIDAAVVDELQGKILARRRGEKPIRVKTARNILSGHFAALIRDGRRVYRLPVQDPFDGLSWPSEHGGLPDPFTSEERDRVVAFFKKERLRWYPWVAVCFWTGMRGSEAAALNISDYDPKAHTLSITKGITEGEENAPKTARSTRTIELLPEAIEALEAMPKRPTADPDDPLFLNANGERMGHKEWPKKSFYPVLAFERVNVRRRKFYATRHTFITELIGRGEPLQAIAEYCGTSVTMIERSYGRWLPKGATDGVKGLRSLSKTGRFAGRVKNRAVGDEAMPLESFTNPEMVPRGIEPGHAISSPADESTENPSDSGDPEHSGPRSAANDRSLKQPLSVEDSGRKPDGSRGGS